MTERKWQHCCGVFGVVWITCVVYVPRADASGLAHASGVQTAKVEVTQQAPGHSPLERDRDGLRAIAKRDRQLRNVAAFVALLAVFALIIAALSFRKRLRRLRLETRLERAYRLETIGQLTGGVAHDFNNVLTVIGQALGLISSETKDNAAIAELVAEAEKATASGARIVEQLLSFARMQPQASGVIDVGRLFDEADPLLRRTAGDAVTLTFKKPSASVYIRVDSGQLIAALINLVANARDAVGGKGEVVVGAAEVNSKVRVFVSDRGHGIAEADQPRIFEPFFTTKAPEKGSGVGLSMVYGFAKESGGSVTVESALGAGTTIGLVFPRSQA